MTNVIENLMFQIDGYNNKNGCDPKKIVVSKEDYLILKMEMEKRINTKIKELEKFEQIPIIIKEDCVIM